MITAITAAVSALLPVILKIVPQLFDGKPKVVEAIEVAGDMAETGLNSFIRLERIQTRIQTLEPGQDFTDIDLDEIFDRRAEGMMDWDAMMARRRVE